VIIGHGRHYSSDSDIPAIAGTFQSAGAGHKDTGTALQSWLDVATCGKMQLGGAPRQTQRLHLLCQGAGAARQRGVVVLILLAAAKMDKSFSYFLSVS
jgi:hypothetical protein